MPLTFSEFNQFRRRLSVACSLIVSFGRGSGFLLILLLLTPAWGDDSPLERHEFVQIRMGVPVRITVYAPDKAVAIQATDAAYARLKALDRCLSDYDPDSELNRLCKHPPGEAVAVSDDLWYMLEQSEKYAEMSGGAFDATIGPVVKLWRIARRKKQLPDPEQLNTAREAVGHHLVKLNAAHKTVTLARSGMQLDFGGIAKGYGADEAYKVLVENKIPIALVAVAGEIRAGDPPPDRAGWNVQIETRSADSSASEKPITLVLCRQAVSTSGDTYQYLELNGIRYSHIVDPNTGLGLTIPSSVTVVSTNCTQTDALATVISVLGPQKGIELLKQYPNASAMIVHLDQNGNPVITRSPGWDDLFF